MLKKQIFQHISTIVVGTLCTAASLGLAACNDGPVAERWRETSRGAFWSREELIKPLQNQYKFQGMKRAEVLKILGQPDYSAKEEEYSGGGGERNDIYQVSMLNNSSFDIEYDIKDVVLQTSYGAGCLASYCPGPEKLNESRSKEGEASSLTPAQAQQRYEKRKKLPRYPDYHDFKELEQLWGEPDVADVDIAPSFPTPLRSSYYSWRLTPDGRTYISVTTMDAFNVALQKRHVSYLAVITLGPDCPTRRPSE